MNFQSLIPWRKVSFWLCSACGKCCIKFNVPLTITEYAKIMNRFGDAVIELDFGKAYLKKNPATGRCIFQKWRNGKWICGIQEIKPLACKLWPFIILNKPKMDEALFTYIGEKFYIYLDKHCPEVKIGKPTNYLTNKVLPEIVKLSLNEKFKQVYSTALLPQAILHQIYKLPNKKETLIRENLHQIIGPVAQLG
ncbi:MAG: YkgJ family cysteine cluster protein [Candidatus Bathyarchaeia archaeon]